MGLADSLIDFLKGSGLKHDKAPEGICPNCWGKQEYGGKFYDVVQKHGVDINQKDPNVGWVEEYAEKHLTGIELHKQGDYYTCNTCKSKYTEADLKK